MLKWPLSKRENARQTSPSKNGDTHAGTLWAICRRLQTRVTELESQTATMRRDINRIDRKGYREAEAFKQDPKPVESPDIPKEWQALFE